MSTDTVAPGNSPPLYPCQLERVAPVSSRSRSAWAPDMSGSSPMSMMEWNMAARSRYLSRTSGRNASPGQGILFLGGEFLQGMWMDEASQVWDGVRFGIKAI